MKNILRTIGTFLMVLVGIIIIIGSSIIGVASIFAPNSFLGKIGTAVTNSTLIIAVVLISVLGIFVIYFAIMAKIRGRAKNKSHHNSSDEGHLPDALDQLNQNQGRARS